MNKKLFVISGSSGVGKGTVLKGFLEQNPEFMLSISCTTRAPREGEIDGVNYFFLNKDEFQKCIDEAKFLEWAEFAGNRYGTKKKFINQCLEEGKNVILEIDTKSHFCLLQEIDGVNYFFLTKDEFKKCVDDEKFLEWAEFAGNCYGTKKKFINQCLEEGKNVILEIDTKGALQVKKQMPEAVLIFICPPSLEALENRLRGRHTEDEATIQKRMNEVKQELARAEAFDYKIVNDDLKRTISELEQIVEKEHKNA